MVGEYSVLMSVYYKENPEFLKRSIESIVNQTIQTNDFVIVCDGPLTEELYSIIKEYRKRYSFIHVYYLKENKGLGLALDFGIKKCRNELIGRMDSDDISVINRFEKELQFMERHPDIDVLGGLISEFENEIGDLGSIRKVPLSNREIKREITKRNPMNHVSVVMKKSKVLKAGGYKHLPYLEDYYLWLRMIIKGCRLANIDEIMVNVRTGREMYKRRGNREQIKGWIYLQRIMRQKRMTSRILSYLNIILLIVFVYTPPQIKEKLYKNFLRKVK